MKKSAVYRWGLVVVVVAACAGAVAFAQEAMSTTERLLKAKAHYASAEYEEVLSLLSGVAMADAQATEAAQYRAFCLIALGREADALDAMELVVNENPAFVPSPTEFSPRVLTLFNDTRRKLLPTVMVRLFKEGREAFGAKANGRALQRFEQVLGLSNDPSVKDATEVADLRVLASGFVDLARAAESSAPKQVAARPADGASPAQTRLPQLARDPVPIRQDLPAWRPPHKVAATTLFEGSVRLQISIDGKVTDVQLVKSINELYDPLVLAAARRWTYEPARDRAGLPIESEKTIQIRLSP